jgi:hypothetical protein
MDTELAVKILSDFYNLSERGEREVRKLIGVKLHNGHDIKEAIVLVRDEYGELMLRMCLPLNIKNCKYCGGVQVFWTPCCLECWDKFLAEYAETPS